MFQFTPPVDARSTDELINVALCEADEDRIWDAIGVLQWRGTRDVLQRAAELLNSSCPVERQLGANILGQLGLPDRTFPDDCVELLLARLRVEQEPPVLEAIFIALSHLGNPRSLPVACRFAEHLDPNVRRGVVHALLGEPAPLAITHLIALSRDTDSDVRDWATFGLGTQLDVDTPEIREALAARLTDDDADTRAEAQMGLALRGDPRAIPAVYEELAQDEVGCLTIEAAELLNTPEIRERLARFRLVDAS